MMTAEDSPAKSSSVIISDPVSICNETNIHDTVILPTSGATSPTDENVITPDSSLLASLRGDEDFTLDTKDLIVKLDHPEKHSSTLDSYITFRISTKTSRIEFDNHEYSVRRRYSDFVWLRQRLEHNHPTHLIPPLPEKHSLHRLSRFTPTFIKTRMIALNRFLARVSEHPVLSFDANFKQFLSLEAWEFAAYRKQGSSLMSRVSDSLHNIAATYMMKERSVEFDDMNTYINKLGEKIGILERIALRIQKEQQDYANALDEFHPVFTLWSASELKLQSGMIAIAKAIEKCSEAQKHIIEENEMKFCAALHEYVLYTDAIKEVLKRRDAIQIEYELTVDELSKRKNERDQLKNSDTPGYSVSAFLGKSSEELKGEKKDKIDRQIEDLIGHVEVNNDKCEVANEDLKSDMERWQNTKEKDLKCMLLGMADRQIDCYQKCLAAWEEAIVDVKNTDNVENDNFDDEDGSA